MSDPDNGERSSQYPSGNPLREEESDDLPIRTHPEFRGIVNFVTEYRSRAEAQAVERSERLIREDPW